MTITLIGTRELKLGLSGAFVADALQVATKRLDVLAALAFEDVELDLGGICEMDADGCALVEQSAQRFASTESRLTIVDPQQRLPDAAADVRRRRTAPRRQAA